MLPDPGTIAVKLLANYLIEQRNQANGAKTIKSRYFGRFGGVNVFRSESRPKPIVSD